MEWQIYEMKLLALIQPFPNTDLQDLEVSEPLFLISHLRGCLRSKRPILPGSCQAPLDSKGKQILGPAIWGFSEGTTCPVKQATVHQDRSPTDLINTLLPPVRKSSAFRGRRKEGDKDFQQRLERTALKATECWGNGHWRPRNHFYVVKRKFGF